MVCATVKSTMNNINRSRHHHHSHQCVMKSRELKLVGKDMRKVLLAMEQDKNFDKAEYLKKLVFDLAFRA